MNNIKINGVEFKHVAKTTYGSFIGISDKYVLKYQKAKHPYKINGIEAEYKIIKHLNDCNCFCVPKLFSFGKLDTGETYIIMDRIIPKGKQTPEDVLFSFLALKGCGVIHGDLKANNILFDGEVAYLIDYDQAIYDPEFKIKSLEETQKKIDVIYPRHKKYCGTLSHQLKPYYTQKLDLSNTTLIKNGISTNANNGNYHDINYSMLYLKGERGISGRKDILDTISFENENVLDIGCNLGELSRYIINRNAKEVWGVEYCSQHAAAGQMINNCLGINNCNIKSGDMSKDLLNKQFDTICLFSVLHHISNMNHAIEQVKNNANRILLECKLSEYGEVYKDGKWQRTNTWNYLNVDNLCEAFKIKFGMKNSYVYGKVDRERYIIEFKN